MIRPHRRRIIFTGLAFILCCTGLMWGLPHHWDFAQDSAVSIGHLARIDAPGVEMTTGRYPPFHFRVLAIPWAASRWLVDSTAISENRKLSDTLFIFSARVVSLAMALGACWLIIRIGRRLWDESTGIAAALLFLLSPLTLYYAKNANLDIPYIFWLACALFFYIRILQEDRRRDYAWLGLTAALAVCTKDQAYAFFVLMPIPLMIRLWKAPATNTEEDRGAAEPWSRLALGLASFVIPFVIIHNIILNPAQFAHHVETIVGPGSVGWREFTQGPIGQLRLLIDVILRLMAALTPAGLMLVGIGLWVELRNRKPGSLTFALLLPVLSCHVFFVAIIGYAPVRFVLPILLVLSLFGGRGIIWLWRQRKKPAFAKGLAITLTAWLALAGLSLNIVMRYYSRYGAQKWLERLQETLPGDTKIYYFGAIRDMPRYNAPIGPGSEDLKSDEAKLNPKPLVAEDESLTFEQALRKKKPGFVVLSLAQGRPGTRSQSIRLAAVVRRNLGVWGLIEGKRAHSTKRSFPEKLIAGEYDYVEAARFESPIAAFVPEVCESVNRTIVIMKREPQP